MKTSKKLTDCFLKLFGLKNPTQAGRLCRITPQTLHNLNNDGGSEPLRFFCALSIKLAMEVPRETRKTILAELLNLETETLTEELE